MTHAEYKARRAALIKRMDAAGDHEEWAVCEDISDQIHSLEYEHLGPEEFE